MINKILVLLVFSLNLFSQGQIDFHFEIDKLSHEFHPSTEIPEVEKTFTLDEVEKLHFIFSGETFLDEEILAENIDSPITCDDTFKLFLYYCKNDISKIRSLYDIDSQKIFDSLDPGIRDKLLAVYTKIESIDLICKVNNGKDVLYFTKTTIDTKNSSIVWNFTKVGERCFLKAGKVSGEFINHVDLAIEKNAFTIDKEFTSSLPLNSIIPIGSNLSFNGKIYGIEESLATFTWFLNEEEKETSEVFEYLFDIAGTNYIKATTDLTKNTIPSKVVVIETDRIIQVLENKEEDVTGLEIVAKVGETIKLKGLSSSESLWPKDYPKWEKDSELLGSDSILELTLDSIGEFNLELVCGTSKKLVRIIVEDL